MDNEERIKTLTNSAKRARALSTLYKSTEFQEYLLPHLKSLRHIQWIDPKKFKDRTEFYLTYEHMRAKASVVDALLSYLGRQEGELRVLSKQIKVLNEKEKTKNTRRA